MLEPLKQKELPYWLEELVEKGRFHQKYQLFSKGDIYVVCENGVIKHIGKDDDENSS